MDEELFNKLKDLPPDEQLLYLKVKELELKAIELKQKGNDTSKQWWQNPLYLAIFGLFANIIVSYFNGCNEQKIERDKVNSNAILEAIKTGDTASAKKNLQFLLGIGFLNDKDGRIQKYLDSTVNIPVLPSFSTNFSDAKSYLRVDTIKESSPLYKITACVGLLKFYSNGKVTSINTAVVLNERTIVLPKVSNSSGSKIIDSIILTLNYNNLNIKGEKIELTPAPGELNENKSFSYYHPKSTFNFVNNISQLETVTPIVGQQIMIIQHPLGQAKAIASDEKFQILKIDVEENKFIYNCKTQPGSGGALILTNDYKIIGLHVGRNPDGTKYGIAFKNLKK